MIGENRGFIFENRERINKLSRGVAMSLAVPDAFLASDENLAIAGGAGTFDGEVGFGASIIMRTGDEWSVSAGSAISGGDVVGKVSARWSR